MHDVDIGEGLYANLNISVGTKLALFKGDILNIEEDDEATILEEHRGYILQLKKNMYLDCFNARQNRECFACCIF